MKKTILILSAALILLVAGLYVQSKKMREYRSKYKSELIKCNSILSDYLKLVNSKTKTDTVYKYLAAKTIHKTVFKAIYDTLYIDANKAYGVYKDSVNSDDLSLYTKIVASDLKSVDYTYFVRQKIINTSSIINRTDTLIIYKRKPALYALLDVGKHSYSAGLQYNTCNRFGFTARINLYQDEKYLSVGAVYRIF